MIRVLVLGAPFDVGVIRRCPCRVNQRSRFYSNGGGDSDIQLAVVLILPQQSHVEPLLGLKELCEGRNTLPEVQEEKVVGIGRGL